MVFYKCVTLKKNPSDNYRFKQKIFVFFCIDNTVKAKQ